MLVLYVFVLYFSLATSSPCSELNSVDITNGIRFPNGSIYYENVEYTSGSWYEIEKNGAVIRLGCPCVVRVCLWKCCGRNQAFLNRSCSNTNLPEVIPFNPPVFKGRDLTSTFAVEHFFYMYNLECDKYLVDSNSVTEELYIQENGTLYEIAANRPQWHSPSKFCADVMLDDSAPTPRLVAGVCYPDEESTDDSPVLYITYGIGLILSVPFLLATFLVYAFIPELRNLHGLCLMAYCGGLIIAYVFLAYLKLHVGKVGVAMTGCYIIAFIVYYAFQTSFFWLNVMCFDIWRTFRAAAPVTQSFKQHS